jgi:hypothetical protein
MKARKYEAGDKDEENNTEREGQFAGETVGFCRRFGKPGQNYGEVTFPQ